jgi:hypothetical protein
MAYSSRSYYFLANLEAAFFDEVEPGMFASVYYYCCYNWFSNRILSSIERLFS